MIKDRGHRVKVIGEIFIRNRSGNFFHSFSSVVGIWNEQQAEVVEAGTIVTLKRHMDRYMESNDFVGYMSQTQANGTS